MELYGKIQMRYGGTGGHAKLKGHGSSAELKEAAADGEGERDFNKSKLVLREGNEVKYGYIRDRVDSYPVNRLCQLLRVQRSAYHDWRDRPGKVVPTEELALHRRMKSLFAASRGNLGSRTLKKHQRHAAVYYNMIRYDPGCNQRCG